MKRYVKIILFIFITTLFSSCITQEDFVHRHYYVTTHYTPYYGATPHNRTVIIYKKKPHIKKYEPQSPKKHSHNNKYKNEKRRYR